MDDLKIIVQNFVKDQYKGTIPLDELNEINQLKDNEYDDSKNDILNVWSTIL